MTTQPQHTWPSVRTVGIDGFLVSFADRLDDTANRAALAFRAAVDEAAWDGVEESSTSLVSAYLRFDPLLVDHETMRSRIEGLIAERDWTRAELPGGRRLWRVPTVYGGTSGPQLDEAAALAGLTPAEAVSLVSQTRVRVQTIGFAPGMPYLGELPEVWDIPRQTSLTARVPAGGLCVAIRQLVLFPVATPTGWRHIGQTALRLFRPDAAASFVLRPGDEVVFEQAPPDALAALADDPDGGAVSESLP